MLTAFKGTFRIINNGLRKAGTNEENKTIMNAENKNEVKLFLLTLNTFHCINGNTNR